MLESSHCRPDLVLCVASIVIAVIIGGCREIPMKRADTPTFDGVSAADEPTFPPHSLDGGTDNSRVDMAGDGFPDADAPIALFLVENNKSTATIVIGSKASNQARLAAEELQWHVEQATGAKLSIVDEPIAKYLPPGEVRVIIGMGELTKELQVNDVGLKNEQYKIVTREREQSLVIIGADTDKSLAMAWGVYDLLDRYLGVRWLWPGKLGTLIPKQPSFGVPVLNLVSGPRLLLRRYRGSTSGVEGQWKQCHQQGSRLPYKFGHSFTKWWHKYGRNNPALFAEPPVGSGYVQPYKIAPDRVKLNLGNPAVAEKIIAEWKAAGKPDNWRIVPNDSAYYCTSDASRQLDLPDIFKPMSIWEGDVPLTRRYVRFWNKLIVKMRAINPNVELITYAYGAYRSPPPDSLKLEPGFVMQIVPHYLDTTTWEGWQRAGLKKIGLRPNWWHMGGSAPYLPLHAEGNYIKKAAGNGMMGIDMDSLLGYWGTQGVRYYLGVRLAARPELSVDTVIDEFCAAFGNAASTVREYFGYWEAFTNKLVISMSGYEAPGGLFYKTVTKHNLPNNALKGSWMIMPYVYTDEVCEPAEALLEQAKSLVAVNSIESKRVQMLIDTFALFRQRVELIRLMFKRTRNPGETLEDFNAAKYTWENMRDQVVKNYGPVIKGGAIPYRLKETGDI